MYSRYDTINIEHSILLRNRLLLLSAISILPTIAIFIVTNKYISFFWLYLLIFLIFIISVVGVDKFLGICFASYASQRQKEFDFQAEMEALKNKMALIMQSVKRRQKYQQFKTAYSLKGNNIKEFEHILAIAMHYEIKEVWVTAFCKNNIVLKVTATIGSARRCGPSDDIRNWRSHIRKLGCDEIRNYHNHPINNNKTGPSTPDLRTNLSMRDSLPETNVPLRTFIVFWNNIYEYRILEYYDDGKTEMHYFFDISTWKDISPSQKESILIKDPNREG